MPQPSSLPQYEIRAAPVRRQRGCRAVIAQIEQDSPAWDAGLEAGMVLTHVQGVPLRDMIEWQWQADGYEVEVTLDTGEVAYLERELGQDWGITFTDCIFDGLITCRNNCEFCFMTMLPKESRGTLTVRDDDYRLSFMQGNFVTLTNLTEEDFERIVECDLSPLHVSVHATGEEVRRKLIGRNAPRGMEMLQRLLEAGIQVHTQLVLCPGINDGVELVRTLGWLERWPGVLSIGLVPLGYTKFQDKFTESYSDRPDDAAEVIDIVREFQEDSRKDTRVTRYHIADEFYIAAGLPFPPAEFYDGYPQFHDGIGMMRSFIDEWAAAKERIEDYAAAHEGPSDTIVVGEAFAKVLGPLVADSPLAGCLSILAVPNGYFGGNVDVTGLLTASDIIPALQQAAPEGKVLLSSAIFNADGKTLDDSTLDGIKHSVSCDFRICVYSPDAILDALEA